MNSTITKRYRVLATTTTGFVDPKVDTTVKWEGTDTDELSREYPPSDIFGADELFQKEIEDGFIITRFTFEQQLADGSWEEIDDPRRRLTPVTDLERAIDAENRRDFPGDYVTSDCDRCGDYGCEECEGDPYGPDCTMCNDQGCAKCMNCVDCHDHGCAKCDPNGVCQECGDYMADVDTLDKEGRCTSCAYYASLRYCEDCSDELPESAEGDLCASCDYDRTRPTCSNNCQEYADGDDGLCSGCRYYLHEVCADCNYNLRTGDDKLCGECRQHEQELKRYNAWWRRTLRACMFWR